MNVIVSIATSGSPIEVINDKVNNDKIIGFFFLFVH